MKETIKQLKTMLPAEQFIVTGSYVLYMNGLCKGNNDLDILLVNPTPATGELLRKLQEEHPVTTSATPSCSLVSIFMWNGAKVDVFLIPKEETPTINIDGIQYSTIAHIIKAKKGINRQKDWLQLYAISEQFCTVEELRKAAVMESPSYKLREPMTPLHPLVPKKPVKKEYVRVDEDEDDC